MTAEANSKTRAEKFTEFLESLYERDDRAALAALRRGLGRAPGEAGEMHRYVVPRVQGLSERQEDAYYTVAALFALYPGRSWRPTGDGSKRETNFGASFGLLARTNQESASVERRFVALLNCRQEELPEHLRNAVSLLRSKEIPVNWAQLIVGINRWNYEDRRVQREWARAFWSLAVESESVDDTALSDIPVETSDETMNAE
jgi:CRISPR system Cascade subunit CasB